MSEQSEKKSMLRTILEDGIEMIQRPFVEKRVRRAFESAKDSIEEQLMENESALMQLRKQVVEVAKSSDKLKDPLNQIIALRTQRTDLQAALAALSEEAKDFL
jgi:hypothetical protein